MSRRGWLLLVAGCAAFALLVAGLLAMVRVWSASSRLPERGSVVERTPGLQYEVEIIFDGRGVPHVRAQDDGSVWFAQGYVHARDRMRQMELGRRRAVGRIAEIFGDEALQSDRRMRILRVAATAQRQLAQMDPAERAVVDAYAAGVNAALLRFRRWIAPEVWMLGIDPEPWQPQDSLALALVLQLQTSDAACAEIRRANQLLHLGRDRAADLWGWTPAEKRSWVPTGEPPSISPEEVEAVTSSCDGMGATSWAVGAQRSATGAALVAAELHQGVRLPNPWYAIHLQGEGVHVAGLSLPGVPGVEIGHTEGVAWGLSTTRMDDQDLYVLDLDDSGSRERIDGTWQPLRTVTEEIVILGRDRPELLKVRLSERGPVVTGNSRETAALAWSGLSGPSAVIGFLRLDAAQSVSEAASAWEGVVGPAFNLVAADRQGHILHHVIGRVPERSRGGGRFPAPGEDSAWAWRGFLPMATNAHRLDPEEGFIVVADHDLFAEGDYPTRERFVGEFAPPWRVRRLRTVLERRTDWDVRATLDLLDDKVLERARALLMIPTPDLQEHAGPTARTLLRWDGTMAAESPAPVVYSRLLLVLGEAIGGDEAERSGLAETPFGPEEILRLLAGGIDETWWDDVRTPEVETREEILPRALSWVDGLGLRQSWGEAHRVRYRHPLQSFPLVGAAWDRLWSRGPFSVGGDDSTISCAPWARREPFRVNAASAFRFVADVGDWDETVVMVPVGASGRPWSSHYSDQLQPWLEGEPHRLAFSRTAVEAGARARLQLLPGE